MRMEMIDSMETYLSESTAIHKIDQSNRNGITLHHAQREDHDKTNRSNHHSTVLENSDRGEEELSNLQEQITYS